jgi:indolepyruvate ferredoxin oxidoreductase beta subunit
VEKIWTNVVTDHQSKTINIILAALGGEGGGVFTNWLIEVAEANNWLCQSTALAGVAQRTGATIYYIELVPKDNLGGSKPVMSLFPAQGDIDIAVSSEIAEAGRMLQRGFISPSKTTLITSNHRVYSITEKSDLSDGTMDSATVTELAKKYSKKCISFDMSELANKHNSVISSALFGALAGADVLPFSKQSFTDVITNSGKIVASNISAFEESYALAQYYAEDKNTIEEMPKVEIFTPEGAQASEAVSDRIVNFSLPDATSEKGAVLLERLKRDFPASTQALIYQGLIRVLDYQDFSYGTQYLDELSEILGGDTGADEYALTTATARYLALWMCFEDIPRVAQIKVRETRMTEIRAEVKATDGQIIHVTEFFSPRADEICAILPRALGSAMLTNRWSRRLIELFAGGKKLRTDSLSVYLSLRLMGSFKHIRRYSLGYHNEWTSIRSWLNQIKAQMDRNPQAAIEIARCGRLVKGYGDTRERTSEQVSAICQYAGSSTNISAEHIINLRTAAVADDINEAFDRVLSENQI